MFTIVYKTKDLSEFRVNLAWKKPIQNSMTMGTLRRMNTCVKFHDGPSHNEGPFVLDLYVTMMQIFAIIHIANPISFYTIAHLVAHTTSYVMFSAHISR